MRDKAQVCYLIKNLSLSSKKYKDFKIVIKDYIINYIHF